MTVSGDNILVSAASISAELNAVSVIAKNMSIGVKNAKAIAARAGDRARGFQPITDFINEMAMEIMRLVVLINAEALLVTKIASQHTRTRDTNQRIEHVLGFDGEMRFRDDLKTATQKVRSELAQERASLRAHAKKLASLLDDIEERVKAAQVIANTSRVEASRAAEYRQSLEVVAENLESATNDIKQRVSKCKHRLNFVLGDVKN